MHSYRAHTYLIFSLFLFFLLPVHLLGQEIQNDERKVRNQYVGDEYTTAGFQFTIFDQESRTMKRLFLGFGLNNTLRRGESLGSRYKLLGSRFFEVGGEFSTALNTTGFYRLNYGLSFQFNGLKPKNNQVFEKDGSETHLIEFSENLKKSKLRLDHLVIPVHFEVGPADVDYQAQSWRIGLGAYSGLRLGTRQTLKFKDEGRNQKKKSAQKLNANDWVYGLSVYIGYGKTALYAKYDLNPVFRHNPTEEHNLSLGLRVTLY